MVWESVWNHLEAREGLVGVRADQGRFSLGQPVPAVSLTLEQKLQVHFLRFLRPVRRLRVISPPTTLLLRFAFIFQPYFPSHTGKPTAV